MSRTATHRACGLKLLQPTLTCLVALLALSGCASVPLDTPKEPSYAVAETANSDEAENIRKWLGGRDDVSGFYPLAEGFDAFGARLRLIALAEASIDGAWAVNSMHHWVDPAAAARWSHS